MICTTDKIFDFLQFQQIPIELHNDSILSQYVDPITRAPIWFVLCNKKAEQVLYERAVIIHYIAQEIEEGKIPRCPISRYPISSKDLETNERIQNIINDRLNVLSRYFEERFRVQESFMRNP